MNSENIKTPDDIAKEIERIFQTLDSFMMYVDNGISALVYLREHAYEVLDQQQLEDIDHKLEIFRKWKTTPIPDELIFQ